MGAPAIVAPQPYDWSSPWMAVVMQTDGLEVPFWVWSPAHEAVRRDLENQFGWKGAHLALVNECLIEWQGAAYDMTLTLSPNYDDAKALLDSTFIRQMETMVKVQIGFLTGLGGPVFQEFLGLVNNAEFSIGTEITITLKTQAPLLPWSKAREGTRRWVGYSRRQIIRELWSAVGAREGPEEIPYAPPIDDSLVSSDDASLATYDAVPPGGRAQGGRSGWWVIGKLADECGLDVFSEGGTLVLKPKSKSLADPPVAVFKLFAEQWMPGPRMVYPILSCNLKTSQLFVRDSRGVFGVGTNLETGKAETATAGKRGDGNKGEKTPPMLVPGGKKPGRGPKSRGAPGTGRLDTERLELLRAWRAEALAVKALATVAEIDRNIALTLARGLDSEGRSIVFAPVSLAVPDLTPATRRAFSSFNNQGVQIEVESLLIPHLRPHQIVKIEGVSDRVDGLYKILKLTFQCGPDGGLTRFEAISNATDVTASTEPSIGKPNKEKADTSGAGASKEPKPA